MAQKPTLIKNIILSEIEYERKRIKLLVTDDVEREQLSDSMDRDHEIISIWCTNFGISKEEIEVKRDQILNDEYIDVLIARDRIIRQSEESIEELIQDPVKNQKDIENTQKNIDNAKVHAQNIHEIIITLKPRPLLWQL